MAKSKRAPAKPRRAAVNVDPNQQTQPEASTAKTPRTSRSRKARTSRPRKAKGDQPTPADTSGEETTGERRERESLEARLAKLERESTQRDREHQEERNELHKKLAKLTNSKEPIEMRATALDPEKSRKQLRAIWPRDSDRLKAIYGMPAPKGKTFLVTPLGDAAADMLPAVVSNCADEGDAKREFFATTGAVPHKTAVRVEPYGDTKRRIDEQEEALDKLAAEIDRMDPKERLQLQAAAPRLVG